MFVYNQSNHHIDMGDYFATVSTSSIDTPLINFVDAHIPLKDIQKLDGPVAYLPSVIEERKRHNFWFPDVQNNNLTGVLPPVIDSSVLLFPNTSGWGIHWIWRNGGQYYYYKGKIVQQDAQFQDYPFELLDSRYKKIRISDQSPYGRFISKISKNSDDRSVGGVISMVDGSYKICSKRVADKLADFQLWMVSSIYPWAQTITKEADILKSIKYSGGHVFSPS